MNTRIEVAKQLRFSICPTQSLTPMQLSGIIKQKISEEGPVSFRDFMEMALYYPGLGYYTSRSDQIGKKGDYYTAPCFTNIFGKLIGKQLEEMWHNLGRKDFTVLEYGAGQGSLCNDILNYLSQNKELYRRLSYCIIEKSTAMRKKEQMALPDKVTWCNSINDVRGFSGCILSNELLDNFSVHQVVMENELMEVFVNYKNEFEELLIPASRQLKDYLAELNVSLPPGFRTEINLEATEWVKDIAFALKDGYIITIDYGYPSSELYSYPKRTGTVRCYHKHKVNSNPYINIGEQDITAHVNFSALHHWGKKNGLTNCGYTNQANFLQGLGLASDLRQLEESNKYQYTWSTEKAMFIHTFLMDMGRKFKVMIQKKGSQISLLAGMRFAQQSL